MGTSTGICHYCGDPATYQTDGPTWHLYAGTYLCDECHISASEGDAITSAEKAIDFAN